MHYLDANKTAVEEARRQLHKNLRVILNKSWRQHPTKHQLYGHRPPITKTIQVRRTRHVGHCWRSRDDHISDILLWTLTYGRAKAGRPARTYIQQQCEDTGCSPEDQPEAMNDREKLRERVRDIRASGTTSWWWLVLCEMQSVSSRIWTRVAVSISYDGNHYTAGTSRPYIVLKFPRDPQAMLIFHWSRLILTQCLFFMGHHLHLSNANSPLVTAYTHALLVLRWSLCWFYLRWDVSVNIIRWVYNSSRWYITVVTVTSVYWLCFTAYQPL